MIEDDIPNIDQQIIQKEATKYHVRYKLIFLFYEI